MKLIVLRGLPGCGKTYFSNSLDFSEKEIISNDILRISNGNYEYNSLKNNSIYKENFKRLNDLMKNKCKLIVIDNCNIGFNNLKIYKDYSEKFDYEYYQVYFEKPKKENLYKNYQSTDKNIKYSSYLNLWKKYYKHNLDINFLDFNLDFLK